MKQSGRLIVGNLLVTSCDFDSYTVFLIWALLRLVSKNCFWTKGVEFIRFIFKII